MRFGRKSLAAVSVVAIGVAVGAANVVPMRTTPAESAKLNALALLQARSPGERAEGAQSSKGPPIHSASLSEAEAPPAGLLAPVRSAAPSAVTTGGAAPSGAILPVAAVAAPAFVGVPATALAPAIPAAVAVSGAGVPVAALAGIGGAAVVVPAIFSGGGNVATALTPTTGPEAPEPGTWLMMMIGFGVLGSSLRRRRRRVASQGSAASAARRTCAQAS